MMDIKLMNNHNGTWDWEFNDHDLSITSNDDSIRNAVVHAIMLREHEMLTEQYKLWGCEAWDYVKAKKTTHVLALITESIRACVKQIDEVSDANVQVISETGYISVLRIILEKEDGNTVVLDDIQI